jgi:hypothetical protein
LAKAANGCSFRFRASLMLSSSFAESTVAAGHGPMTMVDCGSTDGPCDSTTSFVPTRELVAGGAAVGGAWAADS